MKISQKLALFAIINGAVMALVLCGIPVIVLSTVIALGVIGFEIALFLLIFTFNNNNKD